VPSASLREVLEAALMAAPALAHYVFDDQHCVRKHVAVFINQQLVLDRADLTQAVPSGSKVLVIQALSGG
jgi:sulfur carrier protein ThiS